MNLLRVGLVAHDIAPCQAFGLLEAGLKVRGIQTRSVLLEAGRKTPPNDWSEFFGDCGIIIIGMSSGSEWAKAEISVAKWAVQQKKPFGFYADSFGVAKRGWFSSFHDQANFVFVLNQSDADEVSTIFPKATIVPIGNPTHEGYFDWRLSREESRGKIGCKENDFVILVPGVKFLSLNCELLGAIYAGIHTTNPRKTKVLFSLHPGDRNSREEYDWMVALFSTELVPFSVWIREQVPSAELLCGADLVIESTSSIGIEAACKRIPVISFLSSETLDLLEKESGRRVWMPCELGTSLLARSWLDISRYLREKPFDQLRARQAELYLRPQVKSQSVGMMIDTLIKLTSK